MFIRHSYIIKYGIYVHPTLIYIQIVNNVILNDFVMCRKDFIIRVRSVAQLPKMKFRILAPSSDSYKQNFKYYHTLVILKNVAKLLIFREKFYISGLHNISFGS